MHIVLYTYIFNSCWDLWMKISMKTACLETNSPWAEWEDTNTCSLKNTLEIERSNLIKLVTKASKLSFTRWKMRVELKFIDSHFLSPSLVFIVYSPTFSMHSTHCSRLQVLNAYINVCINCDCRCLGRNKYDHILYTVTLSQPPNFCIKE